MHDNSKLIDKTEVRKHPPPLKAQHELKIHSFILIEELEHEISTPPPFAETVPKD